MRNRTRILSARLVAYSLSAAMIFTALPPTAVTSYASTIEVNLDVKASKEIIGKVGVTGTVPYTASVGTVDVTERTNVAYSSGDESIVAVDTNGKYTLKKKGTATITAVYSCELQDGSVAKTTKYISVKVEDHDFAIQIPEDVTNREIEVGDTGTIVPDCLLDEGSVSPESLTFTSTNTEVVKVETNAADGTAKYTALKAGTATVTVTATYQPVAGGTTYTDTKQIVFTVTDKKKPEFTTKNAEISITDTDTTASCLLSNYVEGVDPAATVEYEIVSDTTSSVEGEKATVTEDVVLKATKAGKVYVKVTVTKDGVSAEDYITVRVVDKRTDVSTVAFSDPADKPIEIYAGKSYKINATVTSGTGKYTVADLTWESSDTGVIRVDKSGNIYGVSAGSAEVTATLPNGNAASTIVTAVEVPEAPTISASQESIEELDINGAEAGIDFNMLSVLDIKNAPTGYKVRYSASSLTDVAFNENNKGNDIATFKKAGVYYVTATLQDNNSNDLASTRIIFAVKNTQVAPEAKITKKNTPDAVTTLTKIGEIVDYNAGVELENAEVSDITWKSSNTGAVEIVDGVAVACGEGTSVITASLPNGDYVTWTAKVEIEGAAVVFAEQKEFTLDMGTETSVVYNLATAIEVSNVSIDDVVYQTSSPNATVDAGNVTFTKPGTYYVTAAIKNNGITVSSVILTFNVRKTVGAEDKTISLKTGSTGKVKFTEIGAAKDVNSQIDYGNATSADVTWTSSDENVAVVENGVIVSKGEGAAVVSATLSNGNRVAFAVTVKPVSLTAEKTEFYIDLKDLDSLDTKYELGTLLTLKNPGAYNKQDIKYTVYNRDILSVDMNSNNGAVELEGGLGTTYVRAEVGGAYVIFTFHVVDTTAPDPVKIKYNDTKTNKVDRAFTIKTGEVYGSNLKNLVKVIDGNVATDVEWKVDDTSVVSVTDGVVKGLSAGKAVITAVTRNGYYVTFVVTVADGMKLSATQTNFEIDKKELKSLNLNAFLNLDNPDDKTPAAGTAAAVKYSLSDVTLTSSANSIVETTAGSNTVSFQSTGTAVVKAEVGGQVVTLTFHVTDTTAPDPVKIDYTAGAKRTITVEEGSVYETSLKDYVTVGDKADLKDVKWDVKDSAVATVTNGIVKGISKGTTVVTATTVDGYYVTFVVTVSGKVELTATETDIDLDMGTADSVDFDLKSVMDAENAKLGELGIVYQTSDPTNAAITSEGKLTFKKAGCYYVTATYNGTANQSVLKFTFHVKKTISDSDINVVLKEGQEKTVALTKIDETVDLNERVTLTPAGTTNAVLTWTTSDESVAAVKDGVVVAKSEGAAVVTATLKNGSYIAFAVTVKPVTMTAEKTSFDVDLKDDKDHTYDLSTMLTLANAPAGSTIKYSDFDEKILTVSDKGVVTFTGGTGVTYVRAECNGAYVIYAFHVVNTTAPDPIKIKYVDSILDTQKKMTIRKGALASNNLREFVEVVGGDISDIIWSSSDESVATISDGVVKGISAGTAVITAATKDGYYVTFDVTVQDVMELSAYKTEFDIDLREQKAVDLDAYLKLTNADADVTLASVVCTSSSTDIATVADHKVSFAKTGTVYVKAALNDQVVTFTFHVVDTTLPDPIKLNYKENAEKNITLTVGEAYATNLCEYFEVQGGDISDIKWSVDDDSVVTVTDGVVKALSVGTAVVTASSKDGYYVTFTFKVNPVVKANVVLDTGKSNVVNLTLDSKDAATAVLADNVKSTTVAGADVKGFTWTSSDESVATVASGTVRAQKAGQTVVTVTAPDGSSVSFIVAVSAGAFTGEDQFDASQIVLQLEVTDKESKKLPTVTVDGGKATWSVLDETVAKIAGDNLVQAVGEGLTAAVATAPDGSKFAVSVKVLGQPKASIALNDENTETNIVLQLGKDETRDLWNYVKLSMTGEYKTNSGNQGTTDTAMSKNSAVLMSKITWISSDESVAEVIDGVVAAKAVGKTIVTGTAPDGSMVVFTVTVSAADISGVALKDNESRIVNLTLNDAANNYKDLAAMVEDTCDKINADPATFNWTTADPTVATVSDGVVYAQGKGDTTVTVTAPDGSSVTFIVAVAEGGFAADDTYSEDDLNAIKNWKAELQIGGVESKELPPIKATAGTITWRTDDESIAKISGNSVTAVSEGVTHAIATAPNGSERAFLVTVYANPTLAFEKSSAEVVTGETVLTNVTVNPKNTEVVYTVTCNGEDAVSNDDYVLVSNNGSFSFVPLKAGKFIITGTATIKSKSVSTQLIVNALQDVESVGFTEASKTLYTGRTDDLASLIKWNDGKSDPYNKELTWTSGDESVATVSSTGIVKAVAPGKTYIYATAYNGLKAKIEIVVKQTVTGIELSQTSYELWEGQTDFISATPKPATANIKSITYSSDDEKIATVDTEGKIKAVKGGSTYIKATITWTDEDGKTEKTVTARASILVKAPVTDVVVKRVDTNSSDTIYSNRVGESIQLKAVLTPQNAYDKTILWTSENKDIATVDENGMITTVGKGTTYIYAKCLSGGYGRDGAGTPAVGMIKVVVGGDTLSLSMTPERSEVYPGESVTYKATLAPDTAFEGNVTYESDNAFVTIDETGVATVAENATAGLATITATMTMADGKTTYTAQSLLYIKTPVNSVKFEKEKMTIYLDEDYNLAPIFNEGLSIPSDTSITWSIKDPSIVTVDSYGKMHAAKLGTTWVYATTYNGKRAEILVKVIAAPKEIKLNKEEITCYTGNVQNISYTFNPTYTTETGVTWTTSDSKVAYYDTYTNKIIPVGGGTCYITVTANDKHFGVVSDKVKVTVRQKPTGIVMKDSKLSKKVGNMFKMNATVLPANAFNTAVYWTSTNPAVASVDEFGVVTCHKKGRATIIAITGNGYTAKCKVKVTGKAKKKGVMYGITNVDGLFIRNSASLQGLQLGQYNCGVSVTIVDTIGEWYKIKYNGGYAYVRSAYVTITSDQRSGKVVNASNGKISTETWVYTGVGYGANTVAPVGTRVLVTGASGDYYQVRYGTGSLGNGYVPKSCVTLDKGFRYGVSTKKYKIGEKVSSTPQVTLFRTAKTKKRAYIYNNATSSAKRIGRLMKNTRVVLNSQKINGYYQLIFTNGRIGYVKRSQLKLLKTKVKTNKNTANTYVKAYR